MELENSRLYHGDTLYKRRAGKLEYLIQYILYERKYSCIHADEGVGKSTLGQQFKHCLTTGEPFLNMLDVKKSNCLWVMGEKTEEDHWDRVDQMKPIATIDDTKWALYNTYNTCFDLKADTNRFLEDIAKSGIDYDVIFLDSLSNFVDGDMNHNTTANHWVRNIRRVVDTYGASLMAFSHVKKEQHMQKKGGGSFKVDNGKYLFGAKQWGGFFDIIYELREHNGLHKLVRRKDNRGLCFKELDMQMIVPQEDKEGRLGFIMPVQDNGQATSNEFQIASILQQNHKYMYPNIYNDIRMPRASFHYSVKKLIENKKVSTEIDKNGKTWYVWNLMTPTV